MGASKENSLKEKKFWNIFALHGIFFTFTPSPNENTMTPIEKMITKVQAGKNPHTVVGEFANAKGSEFNGSTRFAYLSGVLKSTVAVLLEEIKHLKGQKSPEIVPNLEWTEATEYIWVAELGGDDVATVTQEGDDNTWNVSFHGLMVHGEGIENATLWAAKDHVFDECKELAVQVAKLK